MGNTSGCEGQVVPRATRGSRGGGAVVVVVGGGGHFRVFWGSQSWRRWAVPFMPFLRTQVSQRLLCRVD
jgi:hypothetical protein